MKVEYTRVYSCRICGQEFQEIPEDAFQLTTNRAGRGHPVTYRFASGQVHVLISKKQVQEGAQVAKEKQV